MGQGLSLHIYIWCILIKMGRNNFLLEKSINHDVTFKTQVTLKQCFEGRLELSMQQNVHNHQSR